MTAERTFTTHEIRRQTCLDGIWDFQPVAFDASDANPRAQAEPSWLTGDRDPRQAPSWQAEPTDPSHPLPTRYTEQAVVPSCWQTDGRHAGAYRGQAAYRREVVIDHPCNIRLVFKGVSHTARVFWDGAPVAFHYNAYTAFDLLLAGVAPGRHRLEVLVDNRFSEDSLLHIPNDYFTYGGIIRPVFMEEVPDLYLEGVGCRIRHGQGGWTARIEVEVRSCSPLPRTADLVCELAGRRAEVRGLALLAGVRRKLCLRMDFTDGQVLSWNPESPVLYPLKVTLEGPGAAGDDLIDRVGFRTVGLVGGRVGINGRPVLLRGVNRHEDHPSFGPAIPLSVMDQDLKLMADAGCNAVRTSHYPNDERFLDLCDERGILVWEESHARDGDEARITNPLFVRQSLDCAGQMVRQHMNHPSIVIWGCLNEAASNRPGAVDVFRSHMELFGRDDTRLHTFASRNLDDDLCQGMVDISAFNIYPGWYDRRSPEQMVDAIAGRLDACGPEGRPLIVSEFGGDGLYGLHDPGRGRWSEEYQGDLVADVAARLMALPRVAGLFVWQFCDCRVDPEWETGWPQTRPGLKNTKGLVDGWRRPKEAYRRLKDLWGR